jgi:hypothetical protein
VLLPWLLRQLLLSAAIHLLQPSLARGEASPGNIDAAAVSAEEVSRIVNHVRGHWLKVRMVLRRLGACM